MSLGGLIVRHGWGPRSRQGRLAAAGGGAADYDDKVADDCNAESCHHIICPSPGLPATPPHSAPFLRLPCRSPARSHPTPHCKGFRELLQRIDLAARLLVIATVAATGSPAAAAGASEAVAGGEAAAAAALVSAMAALESGEGKAAASPSNTTSGSGPDDLFEERLALAAQATSLVANLAGLGTRGFELSAAGLAPQRAWLLRPGTLGLLRPVLEGLADGLAELRHRMEDSSSAGEGAEKEQQEKEQERLQALGPYADLRPSTVSRRRLLDQAEGAVRNLLILLGLPTVVMGSSEEDVVEACGFVIRHAFGMFTGAQTGGRAAVSGTIGALAWWEWDLVVCVHDLADLQARQSWLPTEPSFQTNATLTPNHLVSSDRSCRGLRGHDARAACRRGRPRRLRVGPRLHLALPRRLRQLLPRLRGARGDGGAGAGRAAGGLGRALHGRAGGARPARNAGGPGRPGGMGRTPWMGIMGSAWRQALGIERRVDLTRHPALPCLGLAVPSCAGG